MLLMEARLKATLVTPALRSAYLKNRVDFHGRFAKDLHKELVGYGQRPDEGVDAEMMSGPEGENGPDRGPLPLPSLTSRLLFRHPTPLPERSSATRPPPRVRTRSARSARARS